MDDMALPDVQIRGLDQGAAEDGRERVLVGKIEISERCDRQIDMQRIGRLDEDAFLLPRSSTWASSPIRCE